MQHVVRYDHLNDDVKREVERFDRAIEERLLDQNFLTGDADGLNIQDELADMPTGVTGTEVDYGDMTIPADAMDADDIDDEMLDKYLNAELIFDIGTGSKRKGRVVKHAKGTSGELIDNRAHANPLRMLTHCLIRANTSSSSPRDPPPRTILRTLLQSACMHRSMPRAINFNY